jgi:hypothetical protein
MSLDLIAALAFQAADDPSGLPVLGDAIQEGYLDLISIGRLYGLIADNAPKRHFSEQYDFRSRKEFETCSEWAVCYIRENAATPTPTFARALAAVLLTREWQTKAWWPRQLKLYSDAKVFVDGVEMTEEGSISISWQLSSTSYGQTLPFLHLPIRYDEE